jgi:hypothetical protein
VHITAGDAASLETPWTSTDLRTAFRAMHLGHLRIDVTAHALKITAICGAPTSGEDKTCSPGQILDSTTITPRA